ncbi:MAG: CofH family radical SAM protein [Leptospiraceae bacterium]|nr:CofH family radical SAM protein [Leptospiraceae bacterium]
MAFFQPDRTDAILEKALAGERISGSEALLLYNEGDFLKIQATARELRNRKLRPDVVTYTMFRVVNYTNLCNVDCNFCSFMESYDSERGYTLTADQVVERMREAVAIGADQMFLQGGVNTSLPFDYYLEIMRKVKAELGEHIHIRAFSPVELLALERITGMPLAEVLRELKAAGMDSVPGAGAEILTDRMRAILSPKKAPVSEWVRVMETCHQEGLPGSANVVWGSEETPEELVEHLNVVRDLQDRTGGFKSFIPWTFQPQTKKFKVRTVPAHEYIKVLGLCRIFLDNIDHIETSLMVLGQGVGTIALHAGADDISSIVIEENVLRSYGLKSEARARDFIQSGGFRPVKRNLVYADIEELQPVSG